LEADGDLHGQAVNAAARLTSAARGDEILVSRVVRDLVGMQPELRFVDRGLLPLKGFPDPWHVLAVDWRAVEDARA
jgi:class 3 adenylate cyclase